MKKLVLVLTVFAINFAIAEEKMDHSAHHENKDAKAEMKMDMPAMEGMMKDCMDKKKDNKMCKHEMMKNCSEKMDKKHCEEMMHKMK